MWKILLAYMLALALTGWIPTLFTALFDPVISLAEKKKIVAPIFTALEGSVSMFIAVLIFFWICEKLQIQPSYLMFLLPVLFKSVNNIKRVRRARIVDAETSQSTYLDPGISSVTSMMYGYLIGDMAGLMIALSAHEKLPFY